MFTNDTFVTALKMMFKYTKKDIHVIVTAVITYIIICTTCATNPVVILSLIIVECIKHKFCNSNFLFFTVARLAQEQISPYIREMEKEGKLHKSVIDALFQNGVSKDM